MVSTYNSTNEPLNNYPNSPVKSIATESIDSVSVTQPGGFFLNLEKDININFCNL